MVDFSFFTPINDFELSKAGADDKGRMLIGGFVSSELEDRQNEVVIQKGLDFAPFVDYGWFNDNHKDALTKGQATLGVPAEKDAVTWLEKGQAKPVSGDASDRTGWYVHGELLDTEEGRKVFEIGKALKSIPHRKLGFSLEGKVKDRDGNKVLKAVVHNIAITQAPVNQSAPMEVLSKAFAEAERIMGEDVVKATPPATEPVSVVTENGVSYLKIRLDANAAENISKAIAAGADISKPTGAQAGTGFAMRGESLDPKLFVATFGGPKKKKKNTAAGCDETANTQKSLLNYQSALQLVKTRYPGLDERQTGMLTERIFLNLNARSA